MSEAKHSPAPWHVGGTDSQIIYSADGNAVANAIVYHGKCREGEMGANARLIASSPELLDACQKLLFDVFEDAHPETVKMARAAIAKATT